MLVDGRVWRGSDRGVRCEGASLDMCSWSSAEFRPWDCILSWGRWRLLDAGRIKAFELLKREEEVKLAEHWFGSR